MWQLSACLPQFPLPGKTTSDNTLPLDDPITFCTMLTTTSQPSPAHNTPCSLKCKRTPNTKLLKIKPKNTPSALFSSAFSQVSRQSFQPITTNHFCSIPFSNMTLTLPWTLGSLMTTQITLKEISATPPAQCLPNWMRYCHQSLTSMSVSQPPHLRSLVMRELHQHHSDLVPFSV